MPVYSCCPPNVSCADCSVHGEEFATDREWYAGADYTEGCAVPPCQWVGYRVCLYHPSLSWRIRPWEESKFRGVGHGHWSHHFHTAFACCGVFLPLNCVHVPPRICCPERSYFPYEEIVECSLHIRIYVEVGLCGIVLVGVVFGCTHCQMFCVLELACLSQVHGLFCPRYHLVRVCWVKVRVYACSVFDVLFQGVEEVVGAQCYVYGPCPCPS